MSEDRIEERQKPYLVRMAFAAVGGAVVGFIVEPFLARLPRIALISSLVDTIAADVISWLLGALAFIALTRIERLDHFLTKHLRSISAVASLVLTLALWFDAGMPSDLAPLLLLLLTLLFTRLFLLYCGAVVQASMRDFTTDQESTYRELREEEARAIVAESISLGDPQLAAGVFEVDLAGRAGNATVMAIYGCFCTIFFGLGTVAVAAAVAYVVYGIPLGWSLAIGVILAPVQAGLVMASDELGRRHASQVPLEEKTDPILPSQSED